MISRIRQFGCICLMLFCGHIATMVAQNDTLQGIQKLQQLISDKKIDDARAVLSQQIEVFRSQENYDTLTNYIEFVGSYALSDNNWNKALENAIPFVEELKAINDRNVTKKSLRELAWIYNDAGQPGVAYDLVTEALQYVREDDRVKDGTESGLNYNLGYYASAMGKFPLSKKHYLKSLSLLENQKDKDYELFQQTYNALGGVMWNTAKLDSAKFYFERALGALKNTDTTLMNRFYRPSLVKMNLSVLSYSLGNNEEAISFAEAAVKGFQDFVARSDDEQRKTRAQGHRLVAIDNMGAFYNAMGEFTRADELITYSYLEKKKKFNETDPNVIISLILLAQSKMSLREFEKAEELLDMALDRIEQNKGFQFYWHAAAISTKASLYEEMGLPEKADALYTQSEALYKQTLGTDYTRDYLEELIEMSLFYASQGNSDRALSLAEESYNYIKQSDFKKTMQAFNHTLNLAQVHYRLKNYAQALYYSNEALNNDYGDQLNAEADSILFQYRKPRALLVNGQARYALTENKNEEVLKAILERVETGIDILNQRKTVIKSHEDLNLLIDENNELFSFAKKLRLELFELTKDQRYLDQAITLHESGIYNRIRARLNLRNMIRFSDIPEAVVARERVLKNNLSNSLSSSEEGKINTFFNANTQWNAFLDSLKQNHPEYYKMRYATIEQPLTRLQKNIPENTTVVRYLFIEEQLYGLVVTPMDKNLVTLDAKDLAENISQLAEDQGDLSKVAPLYHKLYLQLWKPLEALVTGEDVIIIPDGALFNLSFETLTPTEIGSFGELATNSLLAKHHLSYNYSLLLLDEGRKVIDYRNNFVAFAPEFSDKMKEDYQIAVTDSLELDKTYLTLLPQPFSLDIAQEYSRLFRGSSFLNEESTKQLFTTKAKEHKIIHIATHAESNNISPELSRLVFAKNVQDKESLADNYLYTYEIYNQNLSSNLAILTACETGKPTHQPGEGMISLAHAFNYAGSESILTSLWKIDEQSSTQIIGHFYENLKLGMPKDEALRLAKLTYIANAEGRTAAPQYWAGLVLMGDASPVALSSEIPFWVWLVGGIVLLILLYFLFKRRSA